jgi:fucose 4-O-acetylase-like acetyltransferase
VGHLSIDLQTVESNVNLKREAKPSEGMNLRISWVDLAKGIGIILVVYGHVLRGINSAHMGLSKKFFTDSDTLVYGFHMPLFFLLSGLFVEKWVKKGFAKAVSQKALTLLVPYLMWSLIQGAINVEMSSLTNSGMTWKQLFTDILVNPFGQFWFLYTIFILFVLYYGLRRVFSVSLILGISVAMYIVSPYIDYWVLGYITKYFLFLVLGSFIMNYDINRIEKSMSNNWYIISSVAWFVLFNVFYLTFKTNVISENLTQLVVALTGVNLVVTGSLYLTRLKLKGIRWLEKLGAMSMAVYLVHILVASGARIILSKFMHVDNIAVQIAADTLLGVVLPVIAFKMAEKIKISNIMFGR